MTRVMGRMFGNEELARRLVEVMNSYGVCGCGSDLIDGHCDVCAMPEADRQAMYGLFGVVEDKMDWLANNIDLDALNGPCRHELHAVSHILDAIRDSMQGTEFDREGPYEGNMEPEELPGVDVTHDPELNPDIVVFKDQEMYGLYAAEGDGDPIALFRNVEEAAEYLKAKDAEIGCDVVVLRTATQGVYKNTLDESFAVQEMIEPRKQDDAAELREQANQTF